MGFPAAFTIVVLTLTPSMITLGPQRGCTQRGMDFQQQNTSRVRSPHKIPPLTAPAPPGNLRTLVKASARASVQVQPFWQRILRNTCPSPFARLCPPPSAFRSEGWPPSGLTGSQSFWGQPHGPASPPNKEVTGPGSPQGEQQRDSRHDGPREVDCVCDVLLLDTPGTFQRT